MKKDRNMGVPYPIYPPYQGIGPMPFGSYQMTQMSCSDNSDLEQRINNLEKRVQNIENMLNSNNTYNSSNYQML